MELRLMDKIRWFNTYLNMWRIFPAYICFLYNRFRQKCEEDLQVWVKHFHEVEGKTKLLQFGFLLINEKETRNVFLNRLHRNPVMFAVVRLFFSPLESLYILMPPERMGGGFYVQHGLSTIIGAKEIGKRCRIFQQVSVGYNGEDNPVIGDDVIISAGAIVIGDVHVGSNSLIGAGAVVIRDVPENAVVAGVPARCIKIKVEK